MSRDGTSDTGQSLRLLNLGCGTTYHEEWTNIDGSFGNRAVLRHDLKRGIPFPDESFNVVYASHLLEHLPREETPRFLAECRRVLKSGGIIRLVVPDLEGICREYLKALEEAERGEVGAEFRHGWMILELYDQVVRTSTGGAMGCLFFSGPELQFIEERIGCTASQRVGAAAPGGRSLRDLLWLLLRRLRIMMAAVAVTPFLGAKGRQYLMEGAFRGSGEIHRWMYDHLSLMRLLEKEGFIRCRAATAFESRIPGFSRYGLDTQGNRPRKPDSLFMEAEKP